MSSPTWPSGPRRWDTLTAAVWSRLGDGASMQGRMTGGAPPTRARSRAFTFLVAAAAVPALLVGQSVLAGAATAAPAALNVATAPMTPSLAAQLSTNVNQHVIVIMKSQLAA